MRNIAITLSNNKNKMAISVGFFHTPSIVTKQLQILQLQNANFIMPEKINIYE